MIALVPAAAAATLLLIAPRVGRLADARAARRLAAGWVAALAVAVGTPALLLTGSGVGSLELRSLGLRFELWGTGWRAVAPVVDLLVGLLAVGMAPVASHPPRTLGRVLAVIGLAVGFVSVENPLLLALLWGLSVRVIHRELADRDDVPGLARVFARYHVPSVLLVAAGAVFLALGLTGSGVVCWLLGIAIREAVLPVHGWLPALVSRAPLGLVVAQVAPQLGVYVHLTALEGVIPHDIAHLFATVGAVTAVGAAALGLAQADARRAAAWLLMSQTGLVAFGLESASATGMAGAVLTWQVMALATSGFVMTLAALEARRGTLTLRSPGGSFARTPRMAVAFLALGFAGVGLPTTLGFVAEDLLVQGTVEEFPQLALAMIVATALNGMNVMRCFFALFSGTRNHIGEHDLTRLETFALSTVIAVLLVGGFAPGLLVG